MKKFYKTNKRERSVESLAPFVSEYSAEDKQWSDILWLFMRNVKLKKLRMNFP